MALLTPQDSQTLTNWGLDQDYKSDRLALVQIARIVYAAICGSFNATPTPVECEGGLAAAFLISNEFGKILRKKRHAQSALWATFATAMARLLLDADWADIVK